MATSRFMLFFFLYLVSVLPGPERPAAFFHEVSRSEVMKGALRASPLLVSVYFLVSCASSRDLTPWRQTYSVPRPESTRGDLSEDFKNVEKLRDDLNLGSSRNLALSLVAENPSDVRALYFASRAESDGVFLFGEEEREKRDLAALSAFDYSQRAVEAGGASAEVLAQHAWAMGTSTHLQPMFDRSEHASKTLEAISAALEKDPGNLVALMTKSILRLRLATLPWIARVMASGAPEGSIEEAIDLARTCVKNRPSVEHRLALAKALVADGSEDEARRVLGNALNATNRYPRDGELRPAAEKLLHEIGEE